MNNKYKIDGNIVTIYSRYKGEMLEILVDLDSLPKITHRSWRIHKGRNTFYAESYDHTRMHRLIMNCTDLDAPVDHKDGNGLNNLTDNLRVSTTSLNGTNRQNKSGNTTSRYLNVYYDSSNNNWRSRVKKDGKAVQLGTYSLEWVAALVSLEYKKALYGDTYIMQEVEKELLQLKADNLQIYEQCIKEYELRKRSRSFAHRETSSGIRWVTWRASRSRWMAKVVVQGKEIPLGQYTDKYEAGRAVTRGILKYLSSKEVDRTPIKI